MSEPVLKESPGRFGPFATTGSEPAATTNPSAPTAQGGEVILRMYRAVLRSIKQAHAELEEASDVQVLVPKGIERAGTIVEELRRSLDHSVAPELCSSLDSLYEFVLHKLELCEQDRNPSHLTDATEILSTLLSAWQVVVGSSASRDFRAAS